jgi:putative CocE/NonD family hydrolase
MRGRWRCSRSAPAAGGTRRRGRRRAWSRRRSTFAPAAWRRCRRRTRRRAWTSSPTTRQTRPETVGRNCWALCTALDDRRRLDGRGDILRYLGEPLDSDLELAGPLTAELYAATSAVDTDFTVTLCDVFEDGTVNTIQDGIVRARYRDGLDHPSLLEPGRVYRYVISLCATSYVVRRGHRLRVDVSSSNFDRYDRNPNTGERFGSSTRMLVAEQAIHHAPGRASHVVLPVITRDH